MGECFREIAGPGLAGRKLCGSLFVLASHFLLLRSWATATRSIVSAHGTPDQGLGQDSNEIVSKKSNVFSGSVSPLSCILSISFLSLRVCMGTQLSVVSAFNEHFLVMGSDRPSAVFRTLEWKQKIEVVPKRIGLESK